MSSKHIFLPINKGYCAFWGSPGSAVVKNLLPMQEAQETQVQSLGQEDPLEEEMATCLIMLAWEIPWTEEPGGLQSTGLQRVGLQRVCVCVCECTCARTHTHTHIYTMHVIHNHSPTQT